MNNRACVNVERCGNMAAPGSQYCLQCFERLWPAEVNPEKVEQAQHWQRHHKHQKREEE